MWKNPDNGHLEIKSSPLCWQAIQEPSCMRCKFTLSDRVEFVGDEERNWKDFGKGKKSMSTYESEAILLPAEESYAPLSVDLINLCKMSNCNKDVTKFKVKMDSIAKDK